jgi:hypothetical protein
LNANSAGRDPFHHPNASFTSVPIRVNVADPKAQSDIRKMSGRTSSPGVQSQ